MDRRSAVDRLESEPDDWDVLVIGGGATGLGVAVDAASRGFRTILLEQHDFAKSTSSRSTKLIHGGFRYLQQGNLSLVFDALHERDLLWQNAPHLVRPQRFLLPTYSWWEKPYYWLGLKFYDMLARGSKFGRSQALNRKEALSLLPTLRAEHLRGGIQYFDGQFDDARLALCLAQTVFDQGGVALNYFRVESLLKEAGHIKGVLARDLETGGEYTLRAKVIINATGIFTDLVRHLDEPQSPALLTTSQGVHVVLDGSFLDSDTALLVPRTADGRVVFAIPWHDHLVIGTTDTAMPDVSLEPKPLREEIDFLLEHAAQYLNRAPTDQDILSTFAGLRPLVRSAGVQNTAQVSRDHTLIVSTSGLITITGGKWTTYRKMAEDTVNRAIKVGNLPDRPCCTRTLHLHGWTGEPTRGWAQVYGEDQKPINRLIHKDPSWPQLLHPQLPYRAVEVIWAVRQEMARSVEDVLARRTRALFLNAKASMEMAPRVAALMARELGKDKSWELDQTGQFVQLARSYLP